MGNNSWIHPPLCFATSGPTKRRKHYFWLLFYQYCVCYFLNIASNPKRNFPSENQFWDYFIRNRLEKLVPLNWNFAPQNLKKQKKPTNLFSNLDFFGPIWGAAPGFSKDFPWISQGFSMDFPPPLLEFPGRPRERPTNL